METISDLTLSTERRDVFIGGEWLPTKSKTKLTVTDPSRETYAGSAREATPEDMDAAVKAARRAFDKGPWPRLPAIERAAYLDRMADEIDRRAPELTELTILERGVPRAQAPSYASMAATTLRETARMARSFEFVTTRRRLDGGFSRVAYEPAGVVVGIAPWNGPLPTAAMKVGPALAAGCTIVLKPSPTTPLATYVLGDIAQEIGLPEGVVNIVAADREVSAHLVANPGVDKVCFTGSSATGKRILAALADRVGRATLELGGKSAVIVLEDADLDSTLPALVHGGIRSTGQACWANTRMLVPAARQSEITEAVAERYREIIVGDAHDEVTEMGPIAFEAQLRKVEGYVEIGRSEGARLVTGGGRPADLDRGWFIEPTLFDQVDNNMRIAREEIFGPVVSVLPYRNIDEAIDVANDSPYGLGGSIITSDPEAGYAVARRIRTGMVGINGMYLDPNVPFGGFKESGLGRENGEEGFRGYLEPKSIGFPAGVELDSDD
jgi:aldehyde dehydrogenase (NAD+)